MARAWCTSCKRFVDATRPIAKKNVEDALIYCPVCQGLTVTLATLKEIDSGERNAEVPKRMFGKMIVRVASGSGITTEDIESKAYETWVDAGKPE